MAEVKLDQVPRKTRELFDKAAAAMERGNLDYAMDMFMAILDAEPRLLQARKMMRAAQVRKFKEKGGGAGSHLAATLGGVGGILAVNLNLKKKPLVALQAAEKLMRADPLNKTFYTLLAQASEAAQMPEAAVDALEMAREVTPQDVGLLNWLARLYQETGDTAAARQCYEEVAALRPNDPAAIKNLKDSQAMDTMTRGRWTEAQDYRDVLKSAEEAKLLEQHSKAVKSDRDVEDLIAETEKKAAADPQNTNYKRALADLYARAGRFQDAEAVLVQATEITGGGDPQIDRALSAIRVRRFDHEIARLRAAGDEAGAAAKEKAKDAFLVSDAEERVRRYPNDLQVKYEYGVLLFEHGKFTEAVQQFQQSQRNPQRRIRSLYYLARCFEEKGQYDIAVEQLEKAASELSLMDDTKKDVLYELGQVNERMGRREKAVEYFKDIYAVDIGYRDVAKKIESAYRA